MQLTLAADQIRTLHEQFCINDCNCIHSYNLNSIGLTFKLRIDWDVCDFRTSSQTLATIRTLVYDTPKKIESLPKFCN
jgi:hypothetical protein